MDLLLKDLLPGQQYAIQVRAKNTSGGISNWSTTFKLTTISDTVAPNPVTSLSWTVNNTGFVGTWIKPTTDSNGLTLRDFAGYQVTVTATVLGSPVSKIYIVQQPRFDFSLEQNIAAFGSPQPTVDVSVKVRDTVGNLSTDVTASATNAIPANLTGLVATGFPQAVQLNWDASVENDFKTYEVYHSTTNGFTPGPGNLLAKTSSNSFTFPTSSFVVHYFKIRQLDVYDQPSASYVSANATPLNTTGIDITAPTGPTGVTVTTAADANGASAHIDVSWTPSASTNIANYVVRYSTDQIAWQYITVPSNQATATISNLKTDTTYYVGVAAISFVSVYSSWVNASTGGYPITTAKDTAAPSTPSTPSVSFNTALVQVSHAMTKAAGGNLESDVRYLEVHASDTTSFTASSSTLIGTIDASAPGITVAANFAVPVTTSVANMYWRVIAVDYTGNKSAQSAQATGLPGLITGANIANATITNAKINDLSAAKLTAGTAFINNLSVQSALTLDAATGYVQSTNFSIGSQTGWRLDQNGLVIYDGTIAAKSLLLQNGQNIARPPFADFEFNADYYHDTSNVPNPLQLTATSGMLAETKFTGFKTGQQAMRIYNTSITGATIHTLHFATGGATATGVNIDVNPGDYIFSVWIKKNGAVDQNIKLGVYTDNSVAVVSSNILINSTTYSQKSAVLTVPSGVSKIKMYIEYTAVTTGYDVLIDSMQLEPKLTADTNPSAWKPPSTTIIDGGAIITGSIRSSSSSATVAGQPAWSINTAGNMQIGDALVRGKIVMGIPDDSRNLLPKTYTSFEDAASSYYNVSTNVPNSTKISVSSGDGALLRLQQLNTGAPPQGTYQMRVFATGVGALGSSTMFCSPSTANLSLVPGQQYIFSVYLKNNDVTKNTKISMGVWNSTNGYTDAMLDQVITTSWVRYSGVLTAPAVATNKLYIDFATQAAETSYNVSIDGLQVEAAPVGVTTPSSFTDGTIGLSSLVAANYVPGSKGWSINSDGTVEFNSATIRGNLVVTGPTGNNIQTSLDLTYPTIFFNNIDGSYGFINAAGASPSTKASIGVNSASYAHVTSGNTIRPRLWMPDQIRLEQVDETAGSGKVAGGSIILNQTSGGIAVYSATTNLIRTNVSLNNTSIVNTYWDTSAVAQTTITQDTSIAAFSKTGTVRLAAGDSPSGGFLQVGTSFMDFISNSSSVYVRFDMSTGLFVYGPNGGWTNLTLSNGWVASGSTIPGYRKDSNGRVHLRGVAVSGTATSGTIFSNVPAGYRPSPDANGALCADSNGANNTPLMKVVASTGNLQIYNVGAGAAIYLDGFNWSTV